MNDQELDLALTAVVADRTRVSAPSVLRQRVREVPIEFGSARGFLSPFNGRFRSMFSATRFVVAGVIVALFGGFLMAGVLTQPSDEAMPAAGASASSEVSHFHPVRLTAERREEVLRELVAPFPERFVGDPVLGGPVTSGGVTIVTFDLWADVEAPDLGVPVQADWRLIASAEPGVYELTRSKVSSLFEVLARLRFEETDTGLHVIDADDGAVLAELEGVSLDFIDDVLEGLYPGFSGYAIVEDDGLVRGDGPWSPGRQLPGRPDRRSRIESTESGFTLYRYPQDSGMVRVWHSDDGVTWAEAEPLGDDPGEP